MKVAVYSIHDFEKPYLEAANHGKHELVFISESLHKTSVNFARSAKAVCVFVNDDVGRETLLALYKMGIRHITLRSAGYNHVNLSVARRLGIKVARVPAYSRHSVAEHAVGLMMALNRKITVANERTHRLDFSLDHLVGFDMKGKTVGIIGTGEIGSIVAKIVHGFGCQILSCDKVKNETLIRRYKIEYTDLDDLCRRSDIITLHVPLTNETIYLLDKTRINLMKKGAMLINTGRGKLIKTKDVVEALKSGQLGYFGMDVYEDESLFFKDNPGIILKDEILSRLMSFSNVIITGHQAFLTEEALTNIAATTIRNLDCFESKKKCRNLLY